MPKPLPLPIRVLVKGPSTVGWLSTMRGPRTDFGFPRALEAELLRDGRPAEVRAITLPSQQTRSTLRHWQQEFMGYSPDVVVLLYGQQETIHLFLPQWLERHVNSLKARPTRLNHLYRERTIRPIWMMLARLQARLDKRVNPTFAHWRPRQVTADLEKLINHIQDIGSPLVLVFEMIPPSSRYHSWFPGMPARLEVMNRAISDMIDRIDLPNVRFYKISELVTKYADGDVEIATPDGFHFSPHMHRMIGKELATEVAAWADTQPHLRLDR